MMLMIGIESEEHTCRKVFISLRVMFSLGDNAKVINGGLGFHGSMNIVIG